ncbi:MAG: GGDEF domain-containing protein [Herbaspirillum sp.]
MPSTPTKQSPVDIAREAFRRLATRRIAPTPDAYRSVYDEIAGSAAAPSAANILAQFTTKLATTTGNAAQLGRQCQLASNDHDWARLGQHLDQLLDKHLHDKPSALPPAMSAPAVDTITPVLPTVTHSAVRPLAPTDLTREHLLRDMLVRTLTLALTSQLQHAPELMAQADTLATKLKFASTETMLNETSISLKQLCFQIEQDSEDMQQQQEMLLKLFKLLLENVNELLDEDSWLAGQIASVQALIAGPIHPAALQEASRSLKDVIYKQGVLKKSLTDAKTTVKNMMLTFVECLSASAASTLDYHQKINHFSTAITGAHDIQDLNVILQDVMRETRMLQTETLRTRDQMTSAQRDVHDADEHIKSLQTQLAQMSELVHEDQLTGSLNRRGLDDALEREMARADRRGSQLCVAMLDLDDFKRLNDTHGHSAGDAALIYLVRVIKDTLRVMDVIARFGGEEFLIMLPDTSLELANQTVTRVQREMTKRIFLHNNQKILVTFSAGLALRGTGESQTSLIQRADKALYKAKKAGKNRVVEAL